MTGDEVERFVRDVHGDEAADACAAIGEATGDDDLTAKAGGARRTWRSKALAALALAYDENIAAYLKAR